MDEYLLLVEDDPTIGPSLEQALRIQGYEVALATTGAAARAACRPRLPALVLLDLGLPDADGVELCRELRAMGSSTSIVVLTARQDEADVVVGLDAGADDYVTKPFRLAELLARIRAHLRRPKNGGAPEVVEIGDLRVDVAARRAFIAGDELALKPREFDLLVLLCTEAGRAVTREHIMEAVWDEHWFGSTKTLDVHVSSLRRKLHSAGVASVPTITALQRVGYRLDPP